MYTQETSLVSNNLHINKDVNVQDYPSNTSIIYEQNTILLNFVNKIIHYPLQC